MSDLPKSNLSPEAEKELAKRVIDLWAGNRELAAFCHKQKLGGDDWKVFCTLSCAFWDELVQGHVKGVKVNPIHKTILDAALGAAALKMQEIASRGRIEPSQSHAE